MFPLWGGGCEMLRPDPASSPLLGAPDNGGTLRGRSQILLLSCHSKGCKAKQEGRGDCVPITPSPCRQGTRAPERRTEEGSAESAPSPVKSLIWAWGI